MKPKETLVHRELPPVTPTEAVAEAMVWAYAQNFKATSRTQRLCADSFSSRDTLLIRFRRLTAVLTHDFCEYNSAYTLLHLHRHHPQLFPKLCLLESSRESSSDLFFRNVNWYRHVCFLVQDQNGVYHAGSPANFDQGGKKNGLNQLFVSDNLTEVLAQVKTFERGRWPKAAYVHHILDQKEKLPIKVAKDRDLPRIRRVQILYIRRLDTGGQTADWDNIYLDSQSKKEFLCP